MNTVIPFLDLKRLNDPYRADIVEAVNRVVSSGWYIGGPEVEAFEHDLATYQESQYVVGVSNGLDALRLILEGYKQLGRLKEGDEIIVPANTYIATILAISQARLKPVLVEPSSDTLNLDTSLVERAVTEKTRGIMIVHLYGRVCWDETLADVAKRHNLLVMEDNAQGIGARATTAGFSGSCLAGSLGHAAAFSFYPTKNLGAMGDAGAVVSNDEELAKAVRAIANYGSDRRYHNIYKGLNCRMDPLQAAVLRVKLARLDSDNGQRRLIVEQYASMVDNERLRFYVACPDYTSNYHQFIVRTAHRDLLKQHLLSAGISTDIHYAVPPHLQPCYTEELGNSYPITEQLAEEILSLPIAPYLTSSEVSTIAEALNSYN